MKTFILFLIVFFQICLVYSQDVKKLGRNDEAGKYMKVNDIEMYYEIYGTGHPLLLVHGNNGSMRGFYNQVKEFSKYFQVIAVDSRAQGKSTDSPQEISYSLMASDCAVLLDSLGIDSVYFYGHSDGAIVGLELAYSHPDKVEKMVLGSGNFLCDTTALFPYALNEVKSWDYSKINTTSDRLIYYTSKSRKEDSIKFEKLKVLLLKYPNFTREQLAEIKTPALILAADHDLIKDEHTLALYHALPNSQLCIVPGTTHILREEKPELVNLIVSDFFNQPNKDIDRFKMFKH